MKLWDFSLRRELVLIKGHSDHLSNIEFNAPGDLLATSCQDGTAKLWNVKDGQLYAAFTDVGVAYFGPDGKTLAYAIGDRDRLKIALWDVDKSQQFASLAGHADYIPYFVFKPGKNIIASLSQDQTIRVWNIAR